MKTNRSFAATLAARFAGVPAVPQRSDSKTILRRVGLATVVVAAIVGTLWSTSGRLAPVPEAATTSHALRPEYIMTLPRQIQDQMRGQVQANAPASSHALRPEYVITLPRQIQDQMQSVVAAPMVAPVPYLLRPEYIATLPAQIQDQMRASGQPSSHAHRIAGQAIWLRPEYVVTLPRQIQEQVQGRQSVTSAMAAPAIPRGALSRPEYVITLPRQIQDQVR
jgi:hypothetical protein